MAKTKKRKYSPRKALVAKVNTGLRHLAVVCIYKGTTNNSICIDFRTGEPMGLSCANELKYVLLHQPFYWDVLCVACGMTPFQEKYVQDRLIRCKNKYTHGQIQREVERIHDELYNSSNTSQIISLAWITKPIPNPDGMYEGDVLRILDRWDAWIPAEPVDDLTTQIADALREQEFAK